MAGFSTYTERSFHGEGVIIYKDGKEIFLDKVEAGMLRNHIQYARVHYWKRFKLPRMIVQKVKK